MSCVDGFVEVKAYHRIDCIGTINLEQSIKHSECVQWNDEEDSGYVIIDCSPARTPTLSLVVVLLSSIFLLANSIIIHTFGNTDCAGDPATNEVTNVSLMCALLVSAIPCNSD